MKGAWVETSRAEQVREAAKGWKQSGAIDGATHSKIEADYPDSRMHLHRAWRVLVFVVATVAILALFWAFFGRTRGLLASGLISAAALALATELLRSGRLSGTGADAATSFWALVFLLFGVQTFFSDTLNLASEDALTAGLATAAGAGALAAWRWGFWFEAGIGAAALYLLLGRWVGGRAAWIAVGALAMVLAYRRLDRASLSPAHRRGLAAVFVVSAAALYAAINLYSYDEQLVEKIHLPFFSGRQPAVSPAAIFRPLCALATAALPALWLAWGIRARRRLLLAIGIVGHGPFGRDPPPLRSDRAALGVPDGLRRRPRGGGAVDPPPPARCAGRRLAWPDGRSSVLRRPGNLASLRARRPSRRPGRSGRAGPRADDRRRRVRGRRRLRAVLGRPTFPSGCRSTRSSRSASGGTCRRRCVRSGSRSTASPRRRGAARS